jgi:hypothetical protein
MKIQKGGLKLKNPSKIGFNAVYDMINSNSGRLQLFTYNSLKGFMITLEVNEADSEYLTLNGTQFTKPVTSFILKFAIITPINNERLPEYKGINKSSESRDSYFEEAKLQQRIWKTSILGGRPEICPPVANFSLFDNDNSKNLLQFLQGKTRHDTRSIFDYLFDYINNNSTSEIGVIVMPKVEMSTTFSDFMDRPNNSNFNGIIINEENKNIARACVAAQISRLFIDIGVIHFDLHRKNALIYLTPNKEIKCLLIDFGRASDIMNDVDDEYLTYYDKEQMREKKAEFFESLFEIDKNEDDDEKRELVLNVLDNIAAIDKSRNQILFDYSNPDYYQMYWYENFPRTTYVPVNAFNILNNSTQVVGTKITKDTIKTYEREGNLVNFNRNLSTFIVPFPRVQTCRDDTEQGMCKVMGGRKTKKHKKHKKLKKHKRTRRVLHIFSFKTPKIK